MTYDSMMREYQPERSVWIIILNWNGLEDTLACLASLEHLEAPTFGVQTVVIDNGSLQNPTSEIERRFPGVKVVRLDSNTGFAGGCNFGAALALQAGADYVLLLNNDTVVQPGFLEPLVAYLDRHPEAAIAAPVICYSNRPNTVWFGGGKIRLALGYFQHRYLNQSREHVPAEPMITDYVSGCCMLVERQLIAAIGLFDERFFAYYEDSDFCLRARQHGYTIACVPQSLIWHKVSASMRRDLSEGTTSPLKHYLLTRNRIATVIKHGSRLQVAVFLLLANTATMLFYLPAFVIRRRWEKLRWFCRGMLHGLQRKFENPVQG
jgi:GT2 family glycosyltransferase